MRQSQLLRPAARAGRQKKHPPSPHQRTATNPAASGSNPAAFLCRQIHSGGAPSSPGIKVAIIRRAVSSSAPTLQRIRVASSRLHRLTAARNAARIPCRSNALLSSSRPSQGSGSGRSIIGGLASSGIQRSSSGIDTSGRCASTQVSVRAGSNGAVGDGSLLVYLARARRGSQPMTGRKRNALVPRICHWTTRRWRRLGAVVIRAAGHFRARQNQARFGAVRVRTTTRYRRDAGRWLADIIVAAKQWALAYTAEGLVRLSLCNASLMGRRDRRPCR